MFCIGMFFSWRKGEGKFSEWGNGIGQAPGRWEMKRTRVITIVTILLSVLAWSLPAGAEVVIGVVKNSEGKTTLFRGEQVLPASAGTRLEAGDRLTTGDDGSLGVVLRDNSSLSIGPGSCLVIEEFLFSPGEGKLGIVARISRGTMAYISGLIGKLAPEKARFETPTASIGIRGTRFAVKVGEPAAE